MIKLIKKNKNKLILFSRNILINIIYRIKLKNNMIPLTYFILIFMIIIFIKFFPFFLYR